MIKLINLVVISFIRVVSNCEKKLNIYVLCIFGIIVMEVNIVIVVFICKLSLVYIRMVNVVFKV